MSGLREPHIKCVECGRFIDSAEILGGFARFHHEPDSHFGREVNEWTCAGCVCRLQHERDTASAIEARRAATGTGAVEDESAVTAKPADAQTEPLP